MQRYDYIQRVIEQLAAALARIAGLQAEGKHVEALAEVQRAYSGLDLNPHLVRSLDSVSLARLLREPTKVHAVARLLKEEADLRESMGELSVADLLRRRALRLCRTLESTPDHPAATLAAELERALAASS